MSDLQRLCQERTRTLNKNQEEPFVVAEALTLEAAIPFRVAVVHKCHRRIGQPK
jgi:hypothetical protein